ncbi:MAG: DNA pilot protein [Microviridae sp.]|nr:MAG: DNA pilot protein [Microviridae sp.]
MGMFDFIGDIFGGVADAVGSIVDPFSSVFKSIGGIAAPAVSYLNAQSGAGTSAASIEAQIQGQRETNKINQEEAQKNRDFQERLSGSAHQREIADLTKAGLNPILSATRLPGASTPAGNMAVAQNPYSGTADTTISAQKLNSIERNRLYLDTINTLADITKKGSETKLNEQNVIKSQMEGLLADTASSLNQQRTFTEIAQQHNLLASTGEKDANKDLLTQKAYSEMINQMVLKASALEKQSNIDLNSAIAGERRAQTGLHQYSLDTNVPVPIKSVTNSANALSGSVGNIFDSIGSGIDIFNPFKYRRK